jgi:hypothetical protein
MLTVARKSQKYGTEAEGMMCSLVPTKHRCARVPRKGSTTISSEGVKEGEREQNVVYGRENSELEDMRGLSYSVISGRLRNVHRLRNGLFLKP